MNGIPEPTRDLLAALLEALDIPAPATIGDGEVYDRLLLARAAHARIALSSALDGCPLGIEWTTTYLRERLAEHPATGYRAWGETKAEAGR